MRTSERRPAGRLAANALPMLSVPSLSVRTTTEIRGLIGRILPIRPAPVTSAGGARGRMAASPLRHTLALFLLALLVLSPACGDGGGEKVSLEGSGQGAAAAGEAAPAGADPAGHPGSSPPEAGAAGTAAAPTGNLATGAEAGDPAASESLHKTVGSFQGWEEITISCEVDGRLSTMPVEIGQRVEKGTLLARLDDTDFRLEVRRAEAALDLARADQENARKEFERKEVLFRDGAIPRATYDIYATRLDQAEAGVRMAEAVLDLERQSLSKTVITAPRAGYVSTKVRSAGEFLNMAVGYELLTLVADRPMKLVFEIPERLAVRVRAGQRVEATVAAFGDRVFEGTVHAISPGASPETRALRVEARFENAGRELRSGYFASVTLHLDEAAGEERAG